MLKEVAEALAALAVIVGIFWKQISISKRVAKNTGLIEQHHADTKSHKVEGRDDAILERIEESIQKAFESFYKRLDKIDERCEGRQDRCNEHFGKIERRMAASSGKPNGD